MSLVAPFSFLLNKPLLWCVLLLYPAVVEGVAGAGVSVPRGLLIESREAQKPRFNAVESMGMARIVYEEYRCALILFLVARDGFNCHICQTEVKEYADASVDHWFSVSEGGPLNVGNLRLAHRLCNRFRGKRVGIALPTKEQAEQDWTIAKLYGLPGVGVHNGPMPKPALLLLQTARVKTDHLKMLPVECFRGCGLKFSPSAVCAPEADLNSAIGAETPSQSADSTTVATAVTQSTTEDCSNKEVL